MGEVKSEERSMNIEKHVVSLELAKKLNKYVKLDTYFYWTKFTYSKGKYILLHRGNEGWSADIEDKIIELYPAPLASELLEILPDAIYLEKYRYYFKMYSSYSWNDNPNRFGIVYYRTPEMNEEYDQNKQTLHREFLEKTTFPDMYVKMLIYLYEQKLLPIIKPEVILDMI